MTFSSITHNIIWLSNLLEWSVPDPGYSLINLTCIKHTPVYSDHKI